MSPVRPALPQQFDVVPAAEVGAILERTDREFVELERAHADTLAEAEEAEALAAAEGVDPHSSTWTMVRLQRFLGDLREEAERDAAATVQVAQQRSRVRVEEAREEAERRRLGYDPDPLVPPIRLSEPSPPRVPQATAPATPAPAPHGVAPVVVPVPVAPVASAPPIPSAPLAASAASAVPAPDVPRPPLAIDGSTFVAPAPQAAPDPAPTNNGTVVGGAVAGLAAGGAVMVATAAPAPVAPSPVVPAPAAEPAFVDEAFWNTTPLESLAGPSAPVADGHLAPGFVPGATLVAAAPMVAPEVPAVPAPAKPGKQSRRERHQTEKADKAEKAEIENAAKQAQRAKPSLLKRIPISAILEVLAVLLILVFILLRLS